LPGCKHSLLISDCIDYHSEGASYIKMMAWDAELVPLGATVIKVCVGVIIQVEKNTNIAHNMFYTNDTTANLTDVVNIWFKKKRTVTTILSNMLPKERVKVFEYSAGNH